MDVLRPPIVKIGRRCYRKNLIQRRETNTAEEEEYTGTVFFIFTTYNNSAAGYFENSRPKKRKICKDERINIE